MMWIALSVGTLYVGLIIVWWIGWAKLIPFHFSESDGSTSVSVIIPVRNEAPHIKSLLRELLEQTYPDPLVEILVVDDHSDDHTLAEIGSLGNNRIKTFSLPDGMYGKKSALKFGIGQSQGELIITCDADCSVQKHWILSFVSYYETYNPVMMLGPVCGSYQQLFSQMQTLELFGLLGSTAGAAAIHHPIMCNGANLAFKKSIYPEIKTIYDHPSIHSGDDMFILQELKKKYNRDIHFIKSPECMVRTRLSDSWVQFFRQRRRWAAKALHYRDLDIILAGITILGTNVLLLITLIAGFITTNFQPFILLFCMKGVIDGLFLCNITGFYGEKRLMRWFPLAHCMYFIYVCSTVLLSFTGANSWKGRRIKY